MTRPLVALAFLLACLAGTESCRAESIVALQAQAKATAEASDYAAEVLQETRNLVANVEERIAASKDEQESVRLRAHLAELQTVVTKRREMAESTSAAALAAQRDLEKALVAAGRLVSFAESVAPIFEDRCIACHNARTAEGRLSMESYAALLKGGESGPAVDVEEPDLSNLYLQVADGSMPKDADPLTKEQIETIRKWIATGAVLDAGADPKAPLITVMPKRPHPAPPEQYRVAIPVTALAFSPDGGLLASSGYHEVLLWNPANGELVRRIPNVAERVYDLAFTKDGQHLIVAAGTPARIGEVRMFETNSGKFVRDFATTTDSIFAVALSPDGTRIASAGADRAVRVHDVATGEEKLLVEDHADWVMDVAWSPDGEWLATASRDKTAKVTSAASGDAKATFNGHGQPVYAVAFTPDGKQLASAGEDKQIRVWNLGDAKEVRKIGGFGGEVFDVAPGPGGHLFTASADRNAREHELGGKAVRTYTGHADFVYTLAIDPTNGRLATAGYDGEVRIWKTDDGTAVSTFVAAPGLGEKAAAP